MSTTWCRDITFEHLKAVTRANVRMLCPGTAAKGLARELAGGGLREGLEELDHARVLVGRDALLHEVLQLPHQGDVPRPARREHDAGLHGRAMLGVRRADDRAFAHGRMRE